MTKELEVVLAVNQSADTNTCGSCHYFSRETDGSEWNLYGQCTFAFPPTREFAKTPPDPDYSRPLNTVLDTERCDFWKSSGKTFIVSQRLKP